MNNYFFEGIEKRLEIYFDSRSLRLLPHSFWSDLLSNTNCEILDSLYGIYFDSYVLSESSLFVYENKLIIKTCGNTLLLKIIPLIKNKWNIIKLLYSHRNFIKPELQSYPYSSFSDEFSFIHELMDKKGFMIPSNEWFIYIFNPFSISSNSPLIEITMTHLDPIIMNSFYFTDKKLSNIFPINFGITSIIDFNTPIIHSFQFTPCGFSLNAHKDSFYYTIHVTPESNFSYVSIETDIPISDYPIFISQIISLFNPKQLSIKTHNISLDLPYKNKYINFSDYNINIYHLDIC